MTTNWIIQVNMGARSDIGTWVDAVRSSGAHIHEVVVVPFSEELPDVESPGPTVVYGSVAFVEAARRSGRWHPGVFGEPDAFSYREWSDRYGSLLLNPPNEVEVTTLEKFAETSRSLTDLVFVRPVLDTKSIPGGVRVVGEFRDWCARMKEDVGLVPPDTGILVNQPHGIEAEWRLFVVDGSVVGAGEYQRAGTMSKARGAPQEIMDFGRKVANTWSPAAAYVLDVCLSGGMPYVVESQGFNSSGGYAADLAPIVNAVNVAAEREWHRRHDEGCALGGR